MPRIFLIGMPGSGKSTWGKIWADEAGLPFFDLDDEIVRSAGKGIPELFGEGEATFRKREADTLELLLARIPQDAVIATGGGTILTPAARSLMRGGYTVWLRVSPELLALRLTKDPGDRPLIQDMPSEKKLASLLAGREKWYREADLCLDGDALNAETIHFILERCTDQP